MGLLDVTSRVLTSYKADISDHKAKVKELTGEQKALAQAELDAAQARNKQADEQLAGLAKVAAAVGAAKLAYDVLASSLKETIEFQKEQAASAEFDIKALQEAAGGLIDDMAAMKFAAETSHGALKLNQQQMELFQQAIRAYTKDGFDAQQVTDAWTEALVSGRTRGLKQFGIEIDETHDRTKKLKEMMAAASDEVNKYGGNLDVAGDDMRRLGVSWQDALDDLKHKIGELVIALRPLLDLLAKAVGIIAELVPSSLGNDPSVRALKEANAMDENGLRYNTWDEDLGLWKAKAAKAQIDAVNDSTKQVLGVMGDAVAQQIRDVTRRTVDDVRRYGAANRKWESEHGLDSYWSFQHDQSTSLPKFDSRLGIEAPGADFGASLDSGWGTENSFNKALDAYRQRDAAVMAERSSRGSRYGEFEERKNKSFLENVFGKLDEFNAYKEALQGLTDAFDSGYKAWASGAESAGQAVKKAIGGAIAAMGANMFVHGLEESAMAVASLFTNPAAAASHAAAAAEFFAGAAVAGVIARQFGGGGAATPGGGAAAGSGHSAPSSLGPGVGSGSTQPTNSTIIIQGDEFAADTPYRRQQRAYDGLQQAKKRGGDGGLIWK